MFAAVELPLKRPVPALAPSAVVVPVTVLAVIIKPLAPELLVPA